MKNDDLIIFIGKTKPIKINCESVRVSIELNGVENNGLQYKYDNSLCMDLRLITNIRKMIEINCNKLLFVFDNLCTLFGMKLLLNPISTSGHVLSGFVLNNRMINVRSPNDKLFDRSIGMIQ